MNWSEWSTSLLGLAVIGIGINLLTDGVKVGAKMARDWQGRQSERARASEQATAERLAGDTQRLLLWIGVFILAALQMLSLSIGLLGLGYLWRGGWNLWLAPTVGVLLAAWFASRGIRSLGLALDVLIAREEAQIQADTQALTERAEALTQQVITASPAPSAERAEQSRGS